MKNHHHILCGFALASSLITTASCSDRSKKEAVTTGLTSTSSAVPPAFPVPSSSPGMPDPFTEISIALENATPEQASNLTAYQENMNRSVAEQVATWKAAGHAVTSASEEKLARARDDFAEKMRTLSLTSTETWENAKSNALVSLQNLRAAYSQLISSSGESDPNRSKL